MDEQLWLRLDIVLNCVPIMVETGVSEVARSRRGFIAAYTNAGGNPLALGYDNFSGQDWRARRNAFVSRHYTQVLNNKEPMWDDYGFPTRRHLALIAWAFSPEPERLQSFLHGE